MDKGWGLTLDSDAIGLFMNKPPSFNLTPRFKHSKHNMFPGIDFPANPPTPSDQNRMAVNEVDFFSDKNKPSIDSKPATSIGMSVKKETSDVNTGLHLLTANTGSDQSTVDDRISSDVEDKRAKSELAMMHVELERVNEENQRLKGMLTQVTNNYGALQMHLLTLMQQQQQQQEQNLKAENTQTNEMVDEKSEELRHESGGSIVPRQFIELGPSASTRMEETSHSNSSDERTLDESTSPQDKASNRDGKAAGREDTPESESWAPNKVPKLVPSKSTTADQPTEATMRKARVSVRARSEAPMISDGCQWRKYGQKMAKGNPCPRAYYRCTMAVGCPVRKQVQRCAEDRTILITTYEGNHNHPLPPAAVAMASTTSAAANMLLSGSMPSADGLMNPNFMARAVLPCSSGMATISASAPFPTVTLDLTQTPSTPPQLQRHPTQFQVPFPPSHHTFIGQPHYNQSKFSGFHVSPAVESAHFPHQSPSPDLHLSADTMRAATAAITSDPNFTAALAAAITSIIGGPRSNNTGNATNVDTTTPNTTTISTRHQQHQDQ